MRRGRISRHPGRAGLRLRDVATAGPGDRIGEGEGADPAVQGSHLTAGAYSDKERMCDVWEKQESPTRGKKRRTWIHMQRKGW